MNCDNVTQGFLSMTKKVPYQPLTTVIYGCFLKITMYIDVLLENLEDK